MGSHRQIPQIGEGQKRCLLGRVSWVDFWGLIALIDLMDS
jgi:hypothetical protein